MSCCCDHPRVGSTQTGLTEPTGNSYNPGEVRLYGRPAGPQLFEMKANDLDEIIENQIAEKKLGRENFAAIRDAVKSVYIESLALIGENITFALSHEKKLYTLPIDINIPSQCCKEGDQYIKSLGVIYGYAYEGHCYKLPKPQIMLLPEEAQRIVGGTCGCDCGYVAELGYAVWSLDKLQRVVVLDVRSDDIKTLVLDENLPGNRSPLAYAQTMLLASPRQRDY
ncbi:hypothetical protein [Rhizobium gallicum]|uniref:hypothetical protein n=1 Tax=Rhizobium gallicum TaxID=56730 RepID=UPI001EF81B62|nr:hypothetical protein [Rhizobium gallicum]ULJ74827.1 hypothetical protein L2W42_31350 [Rhizobium gallicum]